MSVALARSLDRMEVAAVADVHPDVVRTWVSEGVVPHNYKGSAYRFVPQIVALFRIAEALNRYLGPKKRLTKKVIQKFGRDVLDAWNNPGLRRLRIYMDGLTLLIDVTNAIAETSQRVAAKS